LEEVMYFDLTVLRGASVGGEMGEDCICSVCPHWAVR
jgi:hypothetical protein